MTRLPSLPPVAKRLLAGLVILVAGALGAREPLEYDLLLLDELNSRELFDYSLLHLDKMVALYPKERDRLLLARARTCFAARRTKDAETAIAGIPKDSPHYPEAMLILGETSFRTGKFPEAAAAYAVYFREGEVDKRLPDGRNTAAVADFRRHVSVYKQVLEKTGNLKEAQRIVGLLAKIKGGADERGVAFMQLRTTLDIEEAKLEQRQAVSRDNLAKTLAALDQLVFVRDGVGALAYVETARARVLIGGTKLNDVMTNQELNDQKRQEELAKIRDFVEAVNILKTAGPFLEEISSAQGGREELLGGALFYQGKALWGQALLMHHRKRQDRAEPLIKAAAQCFEKVASEFSNSRFQTLALAQHARCAQLAESAYGTKIELTGADAEGEMRLQLEQAMGFFQRKDYKAAIPVLLKAARAGRRSGRLPSVVSPLVVSMGQEGYFLEAEALASYLVDMLPRDETTALCVLQLGASLKQAAGAEKDPVRKAALDDRAAVVWEQFVEIAPMHSRAPMVAYAIADHRYSRAVELAREAGKAPAGQGQEELKARARKAMEAAIPAFRRVVDRFGTSEFAPNATYNLAWCLYETGQRQEAAATFLRYAEDETLESKFVEQRLQAKFRGGECILFGEQPEESVPQFQALIAWLTPGGDQAIGHDSPAARKLRDAAAMNIGYAYDFAAEKMRPELTVQQEILRKNQRTVQECKDQILACERQLESLAKAREEVDREFALVEAECTGFELDFQESARRDALALGEDPEKLAPALRDQARANLQIEVERLKAIKEKQARDNVAGELAALAEAAAEIAGQERALTARLEGLLEAIDELRRQLPRAEGRSEPGAVGVPRLAALAELLPAEVAALAERNRAIQEQAAAKNADWERNEKRIADLETKLQALEARADVLRDDVEAAQNAAEKNRLNKEKEEAEATIRQTQEELRNAYGRREELTPELAGAREKATAAAATLASVSAESVRLVREARACVVRAKWLDARRAATVQAKPFVERLAAALAMPVAERLAQAEALKTMGRAALDAHRAARDAHIAVIVEEQSAVRDVLAEAKVRLTTAAEAVTASQSALAPVQEEFQAWKRKAIGVFEDFMKMPGAAGESLAQTLGKIGTIYLELEEFAKAEATLTKLAKDFPDSEVGKGALFNLARAQFETGKHEEAGTSFDRMLGEPAEVSLANLQYIARTMLEAGREGVALKACTELLARSEKTGHPDYEQARLIRSTTLFRAGTAALRAKRHGQALKYLDTLLKENPRTGFFFDIKFATAEARRFLDPPDLDGAVADLNDISFSNDMVQRIRADYSLGDMWVSTKDQKLVTQGVNRLRLVIDLADPEIEGNLPWIERSLVAAARGYARLGRAEERDAMARMYRERFPQGQFLADLNKLPPPEFGN